MTLEGNQVSSHPQIVVANTHPSAPNNASNPTDTADTVRLSQDRRSQLMYEKYPTVPRTAAFTTGSVQHCDNSHPERILTQSDEATQDARTKYYFTYVLVDECSLILRSLFFSLTTRSLAILFSRVTFHCQQGQCRSNDGCQESPVVSEMWLGVERVTCADE